MRTLTDLSAYFHNRPYVNGTILSPVQCLLPIGYMPNKILEYKKHKSIFGFGRPPLGQDIFCIFVIYLEYVNWLQCTNISSLFITIYSRHLYFSSQLILTYSSIYDDFDFSKKKFAWKSFSLYLETFSIELPNQNLRHIGQWVSEL